MNNLPVLITDKLIQERLAADGQPEADDPRQVTKLSFSFSNLVKISGLDGFMNLTVLRLDNNHLTRIANLSGLPRLQWLDLSHNQITKIEGLAGLTELRDLSLSHNQLTTLEGIEELDSLSTLCVAHNQLHLEQSAELLRLRNLGIRSLSCAGNAAAPERALIVAHLPRLRFLDYTRVAQKDHTAAENNFRDTLLALRLEPGAASPAGAGAAAGVAVGAGAEAGAEHTAPPCDAQIPENLREFLSPRHADTLAHRISTLAADILSEQNSQTLSALHSVSLLYEAASTAWGGAAAAAAAAAPFQAARSLVEEVVSSLLIIQDEADALIRRVLDPAVEQTESAIRAAHQAIAARESEMKAAQVGVHRASADDLISAAVLSPAIVRELNAARKQAVAAHRALVRSESDRAERAEASLRLFGRALTSAAETETENICAFFGSWRDSEKALQAAVGEAAAAAFEAQLTAGDATAPNALLIDRAALSGRLEAAADARLRLLDQVEDAAVSLRTQTVEAATVELSSFERDGHRRRVLELGQWKRQTLAEIDHLLQIG